MRRASVSRARLEEAGLLGSPGPACASALALRPPAIVTPRCVGTGDGLLQKGPGDVACRGCAIGYISLIGRNALLQASVRPEIGSEDDLARRPLSRLANQPRNLEAPAVATNARGSRAMQPQVMPPSFH
ncbi:hypothetical protein DENSPDRAFT_884034 [Dentipellis sp. KUC8613]|nr:hypothetical protein DENSPDRAFT_884034 [Dentipellis sp. KUC8613]